MLKYLIIITLTVFPVVAHAGCEFATGPCSQDSRGNTYHTEKNLGGGYNTSRNGQNYSQTSPNLSGGYTTDFQNGSPSINQNYNPYGSKSQSTSGDISLYQNRYGR